MENLDLTKELIAKAKRRIKRFISTGEKQARVSKNEAHKNVYNYRIQGNNLISFRADKRGYLRQITVKQQESLKEAWTCVSF